MEGVVDLFRSRNLKIFGPDKKASVLEGSKAFAKDFMKKHGIKTAAYEKFTDPSEALKYLDNCEFPLVVKADGLAAGKGVLICPDRESAERAVREIMIDRCFGDAGKEVVLEEFLEGKEASVLSVFDGNVIIPFLSAKDHKKIGEGETGLNTGGMGVVSPNPWFTPEVSAAFERDIMAPTMRGLKAEGLLFAGVIFFGLMITEKGVYLLEYNIRFGDPEAQAVFPLMQTDLLTLLEKAVDGKASSVPMKWIGGASCSVVIASGGYPVSYKKGYEISGLDKVENQCYMAGAVLKDGKAVTSGGRVLNITAVGADMKEAREKVYADVKKIGFTGCVYRTDIGL